MTTFPALIPSSRIFTPGEYPNTPFAGWSGSEARTRHSNVMLSSALRLSFFAINETQLGLLIDHYNASLGGYLPFDIPATVWSGVSDYTDYTLTGYSWRYLSPPIVEDLPCSIYNVELELLSVLPENASTSRRTWTARTGWTVGTAIGLPTGAALAQGADWSILISWGEQDTNAEVFSQNIEASATWAPGTAQEVMGPLKVVLYTGNGSTQSISTVGFKPGIVWTKRRTGATGDHALYENRSGVTKYMMPSSTNTQTTNANSLTAFDVNGFTLGSAAISNVNSADYVAWCWPEGAAAQSNTDGSITTTVSVDATNKTSVFTYAGDSLANATIGHGLGERPDFVVIFRLNSSGQHTVGSHLIGSTQYLALNNNFSRATSSLYFNGFSSTLINLGTATNSPLNVSSVNYMGIAFREVAGASKVSTFTGSGASNNSITCGFSPQFVLIKAYASGDWMYFDTTRGATKQIIHSNAEETTVDKISFDSNGFTVKANQNTNTSGVSYLYLAFR